jgi:hypothetical protein
MFLARKRLLHMDKAEPRDLIGQRLCVPDMKKYLSIVHDRDGWGLRDNDAQLIDYFGFNARAFLSHLKSVLGKDAGRCYFPLAYAGRFAKAVSDAGPQVLASDLSAHWVSHMRSIGLTAEKRSFEDMPAGKFDAVVCFEPYPVSDTLVGYLGILNIMSKDVPYVEILSRGSIAMFFPGGMSRDLEGRIAGGYKRWYPTSANNMERIAYDYGAKTRCDIGLYDNSGNLFFEIQTILPDKRAARRAGMDLEVLGKAAGTASAGGISISAFATELQYGREEIAASLQRLLDVLNKRLEFGAGRMVAHPSIDRDSSDSDNLLKEFPDLVRSVRINE